MFTNSLFLLSDTQKRPKKKQKEKEWIGKKIWDEEYENKKSLRIKKGKREGTIKLGCWGTFKGLWRKAVCNIFSQFLLEIHIF